MDPIETGSPCESGTLGMGTLSYREAKAGPARAEWLEDPTWPADTLGPHMLSTMCLSYIR